MHFEDLSPRRLQGHKDFVTAGLDTLIRRNIVQPVGGELPDIVRYVEQCETVLTNELVRSASIYSQNAWLWYLRRMPNFVFETTGDFLPGGGYHRNLADAITGMGGSTSSPDLQKRASYFVSRSITDNLLRSLLA